MGRMEPPIANGSKPFISPPQQFLLTADRRGAAPAYYVRGEEGWTPTSWAAYRNEVRQAARALVALGVKQGDADGCARLQQAGMGRSWTVAAMMIGASVAGIYFTSSAQDAAYIVNHAQCRDRVGGEGRAFSEDRGRASATERASSCGDDEGRGGGRSFANDLGSSF